jgi:hypothetical protein
MCFVWISEQEKIVPNKTNLLRYITETVFLYCAVRTQIQVKCFCQWGRISPPISAFQCRYISNRAPC